MDTNRFDDLLRSLTVSPSRRGIARVLSGFALAGPLGALLGLADVEAKKKKGKHKNNKKCKSGTKKCGKTCIPSSSCCTGADCDDGETCQNGDCVCIPNCAGKECGNNGCGGSCGGCDDDRTCQSGICVCRAGHDTCADICCGECQDCDGTRNVCVMESGSDTDLCSGGACCGGACCPPFCMCGVPGLSGQLAAFIADYLDLPYPACVANGTGQTCGVGGGVCAAGTECVVPNPQIGIGICVGLCPGVNYPDAI